MLILTSFQVSGPLPPTQGSTPCTRSFWAWLLWVSSAWVFWCPVSVDESTASFGFLRDSKCLSPAKRNVESHWERILSDCSKWNIKAAVYCIMCRLCLSCKWSNLPRLYRPMKNSDINLMDDNQNEWGDDDTDCRSYRVR